VHESAIGPKRRFTAMQRYVRSWNTSRHGADIVSVPPQPRHASLIGGEPRNSSGAGERMSRRSPSRLLVEIDVGERLPVVLIAHDETGVGFLSEPRGAESGGGGLAFWAGRIGLNALERALK
jgi:hypothetical protein